MSLTLPAATIQLVRAVHRLIATARDDSLYNEKALGVLELCGVALETIQAIQAEAGAAQVAVTVPRDLGPRIAALAANGKGVRQIARILAVHPSTVSRRLRRAG
jgi:hypothetical protein